MEKKILIAVDDSRHSESAIRYAADLYATAAPLKYVLFHVEPTISQYLLDEARTRPGARAELDRLMRRSHQTAQAMLEKHQALMASLGVAEADVQILSLPRKFGVAKDILEYGTALLYDAIVVGRRGVSGLMEAFIGSVSNNVVDNSQLLPVWLVDQKGPSSSVMVAVDGSESSLRAVDHLAFIFGNHPDIAVSFFHVAPRLADFCPIDFAETETSALEEIIRQGDKQCIDRFYARALKKLEEAGI
ncbi:MAG TPA: universal stress protein, partial [Desulfosarcina sp.]|nr:universal stress protein [Desulfosarcina sp.]